MSMKPEQEQVPKPGKSTVQADRAKETGSWLDMAMSNAVPSMCLVAALKPDPAAIQQGGHRQRRGWCSDGAITTEEAHAGCKASRLKERGLCDIPGCVGITWVF